MRALALLSGGLDSTLAVKLILDQGIDVVAINFTSPFCLCGRGGCGAAGVAKKFKIPLKIITKGEDYLKVVRKPKYGYGKNMNPCIDCRIYMLREAKKYAEEISAAFIFTGEVLDERPMSQHGKALDTIEKEVGLEGKILRPLSAKLLPQTEAEREGWVDRERLLDIRGRSRRKQLELAKNFQINDYPCPAGGCLLTYKEFASKVRDLFQRQHIVAVRDILLLKIGRHFRFKKNKIIVGRNEDENKRLRNLKDDDDYYFEAPNCGSPVTLLQGPKTKRAIEITAALTARYSDSKENETVVKFGKGEIDRTITVLKLDDKEIENLRIK